MYIGDEEVVATLTEALSQLGPYEESITVPELDRDLADAFATVGLKKVAYIADHDLAAAHLRAAVVQAEQSALKEMEFEEEKAKLSGIPIDDSTGWFQMMFPKIALDRGVAERHHPFGGFA